VLTPLWGCAHFTRHWLPARAQFTLDSAPFFPVLIRAIGPTLAPFGVTDLLADPKLELFSGPGKIAENDNWGTPAGAGHTDGRLTRQTLPEALEWLWQGYGGK
jgi:hypothetical protein